MSNNRTQILNMLADGKITVAEAEKLLNAIDEKPHGSDPGQTRSTNPKNLKYLRVVVDSIDESSGKPEKVNVRIPLQLLKAGIKLNSILPNHTGDKVHSALHEKGFDLDFNNINADSIDELIATLNEFQVEVDSDKDKIRVFCE